MKRAALSDQHHLLHGNDDQKVYIKQWTGDVGELIRDATAKGHLTDWHVAMAPLGNEVFLLNRDGQTWWCQTSLPDYSSARNKSLKNRARRKMKHFISSSNGSSGDSISLCQLGSCSASVHPNLWRDTVAAFSRQLEERGFYHRAAGYLLCLHRVRDAVELLVRHDLYRYKLQRGVPAVISRVCSR